MNNSDMHTVIDNKLEKQKKKTKYE
jgi:hypothetical protein